MPKMKVLRNNANVGYGEKIVVKKHVIDRAKERRVELRNKSEFEIKKTIINEICKSKIVGIFGNEEHRNFYGKIYVCKREGNTLVAVTYLMSKDERKKQEFKKIV